MSDVKLYFKPTSRKVLLMIAFILIFYSVAFFCTPFGDYEIPSCSGFLKIFSALTSLGKLSFLLILVVAYLLSSVIINLTNLHKNAKKN